VPQLMGLQALVLALLPRFSTICVMPESVTGFR
jgi:hypothetical protein